MREALVSATVARWAISGLAGMDPPPRNCPMPQRQVRREGVAQFGLFASSDEARTLFVRDCSSRKLL